MEVDDWLASVTGELGLDPALADHALMSLVLDMVRGVAHGIARPAAPLTAFLVGAAAGRAGGDGQAVRLAVGRVQALLAEGSAPES